MYIHIMYDNHLVLLI